MRDEPQVGMTADLYRMVMEDHVCPYGLKAKDLLEREGVPLGFISLTENLMMVAMGLWMWMK